MLSPGRRDQLHGACDYANEGTPCSGTAKNLDTAASEPEPGEGASFWVVPVSLCRLHAQGLSHHWWSRPATGMIPKPGGPRCSCPGQPPGSGSWAPISLRARTGDWGARAGKAPPSWHIWKARATNVLMQPGAHPSQTPTVPELRLFSLAGLLGLLIFINKTWKPF